MLLSVCITSICALGHEGSGFPADKTGLDDLIASSRSPRDCFDASAHMIRACRASCIPPTFRLAVSTASSTRMTPRWWLTSGVNVVARMATIAAERHVDAVLIAGDVFDLQTVPDRVIRKLFGAMAGFSGPWILIPGNHDAALAESVWTRAQRLDAIPAECAAQYFSRAAWSSRSARRPCSLLR